MLQNLAWLPRARAKIKLTRPNKEPRLRRSRKKPERKKKEKDTKENKIDKKNKTIAPPYWGLILLRPQRAKKRNNAITKTLKETSLRSPIIIAIRRATIPRIASSQKTSRSLGNLHVSDC